MKSKTLVGLCLVLFICSACERETIKPDDPTQFSTSSIVGIWACVGGPGAIVDSVASNIVWYFDIKNNSQVKYMNKTDDFYESTAEYRKSDGYLHIKPNSKWGALVEANYIFDTEHQAIICPSGKIMGFTLESTAELLGSDTIFYVKRKAIDEAVIYDNTGWIKSQYVVRVKGIKKDL